MYQEIERCQALKLINNNNVNNSNYYYYNKNILNCSQCLVANITLSLHTFFWVGGNENKKLFLWSHLVC